VRVRPRDEPSTRNVTRGVAQLCFHVGDFSPGACGYLPSLERTIGTGASLAEYRSVARRYASVRSSEVNEDIVRSTNIARRLNEATFTELFERTSSDDGLRLFGTSSKRALNGLGDGLTNGVEIISTFQAEDYGSRWFESMNQLKSHFTVI
jgi:hypothetical protein